VTFAQRSKRMSQTSVSAPMPGVYDSSSDSDMELIADPELLRRISIVEEKLLQIADEHERRAASPAATSSAPSEPKIDDSHKILPIFKPHAYPCLNTYQQLPVPPSNWPQIPLMLRPSPTLADGCVIRGIRFADSVQYQTFPGICAGCLLPMNNGQETPGKSLVIDFESNMFVGTILVRIRDVKKAAVTRNGEKEESEPASETGYFDGKKRTFQVVVAGKFKRAVPMKECVTGQAFDRPAGQLPNRLAVNTFIKLVSTLAPHLEVDLSGEKPRFLTPLVATAHTVTVREHLDDTTTAAFAGERNERIRNWSIYKGSSNMEAPLVEPAPSDPSSIMQALPPQAKTWAASSSSYDHTTGTEARRRVIRKKAFNSLVGRVAHSTSEEPTFDMGKEYTFEFYQHLLTLADPEDMKLSVAGVKVGISKVLNGQPIRILAGHKNPGTGAVEPFWSFEIWHQALYPLAQAALSPQLVLGAS
jgi:hypothetical protein